MAKKAEQMTATEKAKIEELSQKLGKREREARVLKKKFDDQRAVNATMAPIRVILDNLVRAAETGDITAIEQSAGAAREFLSNNPA